MMGPGELLTLFVNTFGPWLGMVAFVVVMAVVIVQRRANTINYVQRSQTDTQNRVALQGAENEATLVNAILKFADTLTKANEQGSLERQKTFEHLERMTGRLEGLALALLDNTKSSDGLKSVIGEFGSQLDEFGVRIKDIPQIKTDIEGLNKRAETFTNSFGDQLDSHIGPLLALMTTANSGIDILRGTALDMSTSLARATEILIMINNHIKGEVQHVKPLETAQSE